MAARAAQSGGAGKRPSERIHDAEERIGGVPRGQYGGQGYAAGGRGNDHGGSYGKFSRDHEPYRDAQDAKGGARGCGSTCYDCGEVSNIDCGAGYKELLSSFCQLSSLHLVHKFQGNGDNGQCAALISHLSF